MNRSILLAPPAATSPLFAPAITTSLVSCFPLCLSTLPHLNDNTPMDQIEHSSLLDKPQSKNVSAFISLPRELRDLVYTHLLHETRKPPISPDHAQNRTPNSTTPCTIFLETTSPKPALLQLKLTNHQLHAEIQDLLHKQHTSAASHLDIMIQNSCIWPTWTTLPLTPHLDPTISISLRIFSTTREFSTGAYRALWSFFNKLVFQGPCSRTQTLRKPLEIGRLKFEVSLCFPTTVDDLFGTYRDVFERLERLAFDNVGLGHVGSIEAGLGADRRVWRLKQLPTGLTFASRE